MVALSGCATYQAQPIDPSAGAHAFETRSLDSAELQRYVALHPGRGRNPGGPVFWDLETLTLAAYYYNPELDAARARNATSEAVIKTAAQRPNPSLQIPFGYTTNPKPGESPYLLGLGVDIPIETAGKRGYRIEQARKLSMAARLNIGNVAWQVRSRLRTQLLDMYAASHRAEVVAQQVTAQQAVAQMLEKRLSVGAASLPEVSLARLALERSRIDLANIEQQFLDAQAGAATVIGVPLRALVAADIRLDAFDFADPELPDTVAREQAILNRSNVRAALAEYDASQAALQLEIANQYPDIHIGPSYTFDAGVHKFAVSLSGISLPVFNRNEGPIAEAEGRRAEAAARINAAQAQAIGDADRAAQNYRSALVRLHLSESLLSTQRRQMAAQQNAFAVGEADRLGLMLAEQELHATELAHQDALAQVQRGIGQLEDAMQRPLSAADAAVLE
jgi:cobalt-zinc-cadmium efflux system outer membrane protein